jgi:peptidoglycan/LPS O-acetylase OafA/YrhL
VLYHATDFTFPATGLLGVDLFFVLSGFLITTLLLDEQRRRAGAVSLGSFYRRRVLRLLPALVVLLAVFTSVAAAVADAREALVGAAAGLGYVMNHALAAGHADQLPTSLAHLWSLSAEEQFYLVWPLLLLGLFRCRLGLAAWACATAVLLMQLRALDLLASDAGTHRIEFGVDTRSISIVVGCLLALLLAGRVHVPRVPQRLELVAPVLFVALVVIDWKRSLFAGPLLLTALCSAVLVVQALDRSSPVAKALAVAPMVFLGRISYGLYLWHLPILAAFGVMGAGLTWIAVPAVAVALAAATASYYLVEQPFLRRKTRPAADSQPASVPASEVVVAVQPR